MLTYNSIRIVCFYLFLIRISSKDPPIILKLWEAPTRILRLIDALFYYF